MKIGIIGYGFVGKAVSNAYANIKSQVILYDPLLGYNVNFQEFNNCDAVFICVPSPSKSNGECDTSILENSLENLKNYNNVIISKVTAPPSTYFKLSKIYKNLVHSPEFLTASNADKDYKNGEFSIIGGDSEYVDKAVTIISSAQKNLKNIKKCKIEEASMCKYVINSFLALKVSFLNQIYDLCVSENIDYNNIIEQVAVEKRLGNSHFLVPGLNGERGFGGHCFPKDTVAFLREAENHDIDLSILRSAITYNNNLRKNL